MDEQNKQEQTQGTPATEETKSFSFDKDAIVKWLKDTWADKLKCLYILTLFLQVLFIIMQFVPVMKIPVKVTIMGAQIETFSVCGFCGHETQKPMDKVFWVLLAAFVLTVFPTIKYFTKKNSDRYGKVGRGIIGVIIFLIFFWAMMEAGYEMAEDYAKYGAEFELLGGGKFYFIVGLALLVALVVLSRKVKKQKEEEKIQERVQEELEKQKQEEEKQSATQEETPLQVSEETPAEEETPAAQDENIVTDAEAEDNLPQA